MFSNIKISMRLGLGFGLLIIFIIGVGWYSIIEMKTLAELTAKLYRHPFTVSVTVRDIRADIFAIQRSMKDIVLAEDEAHLVAAEQKVEEYDKEVHRYFDIVMERFLGDKSDVKAAYQAFVDWKPIRDEVILHVERGEQQQAAEIIRNKGDKHVDALNEKIDFLINFANEKGELFYKNAQVQETTITNTMIILFGLTTFFSIFASLLISRSILRPLARGVMLAEAIAKGDMSQRLNSESKDEIGILSRALDRSCIDLGKMLGHIKNIAGLLTNASKELTLVSTQLASGSEEMTAQSNNVASATEQMSTNINTMAAAAEEMSVNIAGVSTTADQMTGSMKSVSSSIEEMSHAINEIAQNAQNGAKISEKAMEMSNEATSTMNNLGGAAKDIGQVTEVIKRIAEQTNLLALNATIEAASAGEAGKGFAVVANEIKELANQSAQAAGDISKRIQGVQNNTEGAVSVIAEVSNIINKINESSEVITGAVEQQTNMVHEISANITQSTDGISDIATSMSEVTIGANDMSKNTGEAAKGANEVSSNILGVNSAANEANHSAQQVNNSATNLSELADQLQDLVGQFKIENAKDIELNTLF